MSKTIRKFSKQGKGTQYKRKTTGKKPIRRKTVRRGKKMGGLAEAAQNVEMEVNEIARLFFERPRSQENMNNAIAKLTILARGGKKSCSSSYINKMGSKIGLTKDHKDTNCELSKEKGYLKASMISDKLGQGEQNFHKYIRNKADRGYAVNEKQIEQMKTADSELQALEIYELFKSDPNYYLTNGPDELGLQRIILDVLETKYFDDTNKSIPPLELEDISRGFDIKVNNPLEKWRKANGKGTRNDESYKGPMRDVYNEVKERYENNT